MQSRYLILSLNEAEYGSQVLIMFRLEAVHLSGLRSGKHVHLKDGSQSCLARSDLQGYVNLQSIKNKIHNMIFSRYR